MKISVIIPAYNEEMAIDGVLTSLEEALLGRDAEIIVVDDCSIDCTSQNVRMN